MSTSESLTRAPCASQCGAADTAGAAPKDQMQASAEVASQVILAQNTNPLGGIHVMSIISRGNSFFVRLSAHVSDPPCERHGPVHLHSQVGLPPPLVPSPPLPLPTLARLVSQSDLPRFSYPHTDAIPHVAGSPRHVGYKGGIRRVGGVQLQTFAWLGMVFEPAAA